ncbi:hypothetical protein BD626DRAFT_476016 [Schizophyllum amplum]|uniref:Uncharacterized protein n=1 Tax=Schizophyllum amplum TaxID=97359 RepID=A0A550CZ04_9AGAR|nr:hypothetical protein BD626DRAFT_476016 [Auriculariopsis ampla]
MSPSPNRPSSRRSRWLQGLMHPRSAGVFTRARSPPSLTRASPPPPPHLSSPSLPLPPPMPSSPPVESSISARLVPPPTPGRSISLNAPSSLRPIASTLSTYPSTTLQQPPTPENSFASVWEKAVANYEDLAGVSLLAQNSDLFDSSDAIFKYITTHQELSADRSNSLQQVLGPVATAVETLCTNVGQGVDLILGPSKAVFTVLAELVKAATIANFDGIVDALDVLGHHLQSIKLSSFQAAHGDGTVSGPTVNLLAHVLVALGVIRRIQKEGRLVSWSKKRRDMIYATLLELSRLASSLQANLNIVTKSMTMLTTSDAWIKEEEEETREHLICITKIAQEVYDMISQNQASTLEQTMANRVILQKIQTTLLQQVVDTSRREETADLDKIFRWLHYPDSSIKLNGLLDDRVQATGSWFLDGEEFSALKLGMKRCLWLHGQAGCGKSSMIAASIRDLRAYAACSDPAALIVIHVFDTTSVHPRNLRALLSSMLCQLSRDSDDCLLSMLEFRKENSVGRAEAPIAAMRHQLDKMLRTMQPRIFLIVDALDECSDSRIIPFLESVQTLSNISLLVSSRTEIHCRAILTNLCDAQVCMGEKLVAGDIDAMITTFLSSHGQLAAATDLKRLKDTLLAAANGNFRWIKLQLQELAQVADSSAQDKKLLKAMPETLMVYYHQYLARIPLHAREHVLILLLWVVFSRRPLSVADFAQLLSFDYSQRQPRFDATLAPSRQDDVLSLVGSTFISVDDGQVRLAHASVKEYLLALPPSSPFYIDINRAYGLMARTGLAYILANAPSAADDHHSSNRHHLTWTWVIYASKVDSNEDSSLMEDITNVISRITSRDKLAVYLHTAALVGHIPLLRVLAERVDVNCYIELDEPDGMIYATPLHRAVSAGHAEAARLLMDKGAVVDARDGASRAAATMSEDRMELIGRGPEGDNSHRGGRTPLQLAAQCGYLELVRLLVDRGSSVDTREGTDRTSLHIAVENGHVEVARFLLDAGSEVDARDAAGRMPLQLAAKRGQLILVRLLVDRGADIQSREQGGKTTLHLAAENDHVEDTTLCCGGKWSSRARSSAREPWGGRMCERGERRIPIRRRCRPQPRRSRSPSPQCRC